MWSVRALLSLTALSIAACGGFLGFGDGDDDAPSPSEPDASTIEDGAEPGPPADASGQVYIDAIAAGDASIDVVDLTPIDAGSEVLVWAPFELALVGQDGADVAPNMEHWKTALLHGAVAARTLGSDPAFVAFVFPPQGKVFLSFSLRIAAMAAKPGAEFVRVRGGGTAFSFTMVVQDDGVFALRDGTMFVLAGAKMQVGTSYRVGVEVDVAASMLRAGFVEEAGGKPVPPTPVQMRWQGAGPVEEVAIGALASPMGFSLAVDDVLVSTKGFVRP